MTKISKSEAEKLTKRWRWKHDAQGKPTTTPNYVLKNNVHYWSFKEKDIYDLWTQSVTPNSPQDPNDIVFLRFYLGEELVEIDGSEIERTTLLAVAVRGVTMRDPQGSIVGYEEKDFVEGKIFKAQLIGDDFIKPALDHNLKVFANRGEHITQSKTKQEVSKEKRLEANMPYPRFILPNEAHDYILEIREDFENTELVPRVERNGKEIKAWTFSAANLGWLYHYTEKVENLGFFKFYLAAKPGRPSASTVVMLTSDKQNKDMIDWNTNSSDAKQALEYAEPCPTFCEPPSSLTED